MTSAVAPSTSPTKSSPDTTPALRRFSTKALPTRRPSAALQRLVKHVGAFGAARVGRNDAERPIRQSLDVVDEQRRGGQRHRRAAKGVLEGGRVVHVEGGDGIGPDGLEKARHIARGYRVVGFGAPVFARVAEIGNEGGHPRGAAVLQRADEEQKPAKLVIGALLRSRRAGFAIQKHRRRGPPRAGAPCALHPRIRVPHARPKAASARPRPRRRARRLPCRANKDNRRSVMGQSHRIPARSL